MSRQPPQAQGLSRYVLLLIALLIVGLAGYAGFRLYVRSELPAASGLGLVLLASMAGIASFFSPCSFPLLVTLLSRATGGPERAVRGRVTDALQFAAALSLGSSLLLALAGLGIALGASPIFQGITFGSLTGRLIRSSAGVTLILLGLVQAKVLPASFDRLWPLAAPLMKAQARLRRSRPGLAFGMFGFAYLLAGFG